MISDTMDQSVSLVKSLINDLIEEAITRSVHQKFEEKNLVLTRYFLKLIIFLKNCHHL